MESYIAIRPKMIPPNRSGKKYEDGLLENDHGWLSPEGIFNPCEYGDHDDLADDRLYLEKIIPTKTLSDTPSTLLERCGWIKIQCGNVYLPSHKKIDDSFPVTKKQLTTILDYLYIHKETDILHYDFRVTD